MVAECRLAQLIALTHFSDFFVVCPRRRICAPEGRSSRSAGRSVLTSPDELGQQPVGALRVVRHEAGAAAAEDSDQAPCEPPPHSLPIFKELDEFRQKPTPNH